MLQSMENPKDASVVVPQSTDDLKVEVDVLKRRIVALENTKEVTHAKLYHATYLSMLEDTCMIFVAKAINSAVVL